MRNATAPAFNARLKRLKLVLMDVDGVLTDGKLYHMLGADGELVELKGVDTQDGIALVWLAAAGIRTGVISGRRSDGFAARAKMLKMTYVVQGTTEKLPAWRDILRRAGAGEDEAAFIGDDLPDLPLVRRAGVGVAVANARPELKKAASYVTKAPGGAGALREFCELALKARGQWDAVLARYGA